MPVPFCCRNRCCCRCPLLLLLALLLLLLLLLALTPSGRGVVALSISTAAASSSSVSGCGFELQVASEARPFVSDGRNLLTAAKPTSAMEAPMTDGSIAGKRGVNEPYRSPPSAGPTIWMTGPEAKTRVSTSDWRPAPDHLRERPDEGHVTVLRENEAYEQCRPRLQAKPARRCPQRWMPSRVASTHGRQYDRSAYPRP